MDFSSTQISPEEFTMDQIQTILTEARLQLDEDKRSIQSKKKRNSFGFF